MPSNDASYQRAYYEKNKDRLKARKRAYWLANQDQQREAARSYRAKKRAELATYKLECGCARCGYNRCATALDFHHRDPTDKAFNIGEGHASARAHKKVWEEIAKCDVLCKNCHAEVEANLSAPEA